MALTFTSHFYGARRSVGYVPFNSETLVTGKLFEDIRDAIYKLADPANYDAIVITNLCVPTASGRSPSTPAESDQRRPHHRDRCPRLWDSDACRSQGRPGWRDAQLCPPRGRKRGPVSAPVKGRSDAALHRASWRNVSGRSRWDSRPCWSRWASLPGQSCRRANGVSSTRRLDCAAVAAIHPFYKASVREFEAAGRPIVGSGASRARRYGCLARCDRGKLQCCARHTIDVAKNRFLPAIASRACRKPDQGPHYAVGL